MSIAVYAGTFDPMHIGHIDIINKASKMFTKIIVLVAKNPSKTPYFSEQIRLDIINKSLSHLNNIVVDILPIGKTVVEYAHDNNAEFLIRGIRNEQDVQYELTLADMNETLEPTINTIFIKGSKSLGSVSSSLVRELIKVHSNKATMFYKR